MAATNLWVWPAKLGWRVRFNGIDHWAWSRRGAVRKGLAEARRQRSMLTYQVE